MRFFRPSLIGRWLYPGSVFRMKTESKSVCLTFDDGPDPASTPKILEILKKSNVKVIFFCNGKSAERQRELIDQIIVRGHLIGNHGYDHPDGWRTGSEEYIADVSRASPLTSSTLFRPPFGRLRLKQYWVLKQKFNIIFWDLMPYDFDKNFGSEKSLQILKKLIRPGSIIVMHDKPGSSALKFLPEFIDYAMTSGYEFVVPDFKERV